jgi:hypothetical protein
MSILSDARQLLAETDQKIRDPTLTATETAWAAINFADKMSVMLPEVLAYADLNEARAIQDRARGNFYKDMMESGKQAFWLGEDAPDHVEHEHIDRRNLDLYMDLAAKDLSADLPSRITEEEKAAIRRLIEPIEILLVDHDTDPEIEDAVKILRGMIS